MHGPQRVCGFCGRSSEEIRKLADSDQGQGVLISGKTGAICSLCVSRVYKMLQPGPKLRAGRPGRRGTSREWLLHIGLSSQDLRDSLAADVASGVASLRQPRAVSIRGLEVIDVDTGPAITLHIHTPAPVSAAAAQKTAVAELRHYRAGLDLSGLSI